MYDFLASPVLVTCHSKMLELIRVRLRLIFPSRAKIIVQPYMRMSFFVTSSPSSISKLRIFSVRPPLRLPRERVAGSLRHNPSPEIRLDIAARSRIVVVGSGPCVSACCPVPWLLAQNQAMAAASPRLLCFVIYCGKAAGPLKKAPVAEMRLNIGLQCISGFVDVG